MNKKIIVIGGGAAGMMAAISAASNGAEVILLEKNEKLGKKIYITGKGRCNVTNMAERDVIFDSICSNNKFFYSSFKTLDNFETCKLFESFGLQLKVERGNRVFPESDKSSDVIKALERQLRKLNVKVFLSTRVDKIEKNNDNSFNIKTVSGQEKKDFTCDAVVVATGGLSYPSTGSTGDGYEFAKGFGHKITELYPSLVPFHLSDNVKPLQGLSLKNVTLSIYNEQKLLYNDFGEMLFTHNGISGPLILSASTKCVKLLYNGIKLKACIDLKPALDEKTLDARFLREFNGNENRQIKNVMGKLLPASLIQPFLKKAGINENKQINSITASEREKLIKTMKALEFTVTGFGGYPEAVITKGGINVKEISPKTMESKLVKGLYFAGELIDLDALTGGFNLQIAWSCGYVAGLNAATEQGE